jgi:RNA polymerase sigma factor for flagellar operon FliA
MERPQMSYALAVETRPLTQTATREERILAHAGLAKRMALRMAGRLPASVDLDDLIGAGLLGLMDAVDRFEEERSIPFEAYARTRIQGAILDALRAEDHLSRRDRRRGREADKAEEKLRASLRREPSSDEIRKARKNVPPTLPHGLAFVSFDEESGEGAANCDDDRADPFTRVAASETSVVLRAAVESLDERDRLILSLYYEQELTYREIGSILGVTESRICQLLRTAHGKLKETLTGHV